MNSKPLSLCLLEGTCFGILGSRFAFFVLTDSLMGGEKFVVMNILFKFATDDNGLFGSDFAAAKVCDSCIVQLSPDAL